MIHTHCSIPFYDHSGSLVTPLKWTNLDILGHISISPLNPHDVLILIILSIEIVAKIIIVAILVFCYDIPITINHYYLRY
jgi:hypothetical protein